MGEFDLLPHKNEPLLEYIEVNIFERTIIIWWLFTSINQLFIFDSVANTMYLPSEYNFPPNNHVLPLQVSFKISLYISSR